MRAPIHRLAFLLLVAFQFLFPVAAHAIDLTDIAREAAAYRADLIAAAKGEDPRRIDILIQQSKAEADARRFAEAVSLRARAIGLGDESYDSWFTLAGLLEGAGEQRKAALAAYRAFVETDQYELQAASMNMVAKQFDNLDEKRLALAAYEEAQRYNYDEQAANRAEQIRQMLAFSLTGTKLNIDGETPEACLEFRGDLATPDTVKYEDYIRIEPDVKATYRVSGSQLCVGNLSFGQSYKITVLKGLSALDQQKLTENEEWAFSVGDRAPSIGFRNQAYVLPKVGSTGVPLVTVNVDKAKLRLMRINDRNLINELYDGRFLNNLEEYDRERIAEKSGEEIWTGEMDVAVDRNKRVVTAFPIDEVVPDTQPGIYILMAHNAADEENEQDYSWRWQPQATQWLVVSDIGLTAFDGTDGLNIQARSLETGRAMHRLELRLIARNNEILGKALTDTSGMAHFDPGLLRGSGGRTATAIMAFRRDGDFSFLDISGPAFDLSDRGVGGRAMPADVDIFFYTDRGVYRPGETAHVMALSRDPSAAALSGQKLTFRLLRPDGIEAKRFVDVTDTGGGYSLDVDLPSTARTGPWTVEAYLDPEGDPLSSTQFLVEDVVPARIEAKLSAKADVLTPPAPLPVEIDAKYLYGAPAANLPVKAEVVIAADPQPFADLPGYRFGLADEKVESQRLTYDDSSTDDQGHLELDMSFDEVPDAQVPLSATLRVEVYEFGGRPVIESLTRPIRNKDLYLGIKPLFANDEVAAGSNAEFEVVALGADGKPKAQSGLSYRLVREDWDYVWFYRDNRWDYDYVVRDAESSTGAMSVDPGQPGKLSLPVQWGPYRVEVFDPASGTASSVRFYAGWWSAPGTGGTPDKMQVVADKELYNVGDKAEIRLTAPFAGEAQVTIATDHVLDSFSVSVPKDGKTIKLPVDKAWGAGAYVLVNAYRAGKGDTHGPGRAIGLTWLAIDPKPRNLEIALTLPEKMEPRQKIEVPVTVTNLAGKDAYVTLAAVDEGILQLTDFETPDPLGYYFGKRRLGVEIRDLYGQLIDGKEGKRGTIRSGGDGEGLAKRGAPKEIKLVALFSGIVKLDAAGKATVSFEVPDYNGRLRLMAVAWDGQNVGATEAPLVVRDPVVALSSAARFLAPGDNSNVSLSLQNVEGAAGTYTIDLTASDNLRLTGETRLTVDLAPGASHDWRTGVQALAVGEGHITMNMQGPGGFSLTRDVNLPVRAAQPAISQTLTQRLLPDAALKISANAMADFLPETADLRLSFSSHPNLDVQSVLADLYHYPYGCLEQTTSVAFPLLFTNEVSEAWSLENKYAKSDPKEVQVAIGRILERQRSDGLFGLWTSFSPPENWLSAFAMDFLTQARDRGYDVSDVAYRHGLDGLRYVATDYNNDSADNLAARAYASYVLAKAKEAKLSELRYLADNYLDRMPSGLALAQLGTALALNGDVSRANAAFDAALVASNRARRHLADYGSDLRDLAAIVTLMTEAKLPGRDATLYLDTLANLQSARGYLSTQEQVWILMAARATTSDAEPQVSIARDATTASSQSRPYYLHLASDDLGGGSTFVNKGKQPVYAKATVLGVPIADLPPEQSGFDIKRVYYTLTGEPVELKNVRQNDVLVAVVSGSVRAADYRRALIVDLLPAGFEIENERLTDTRRTGDLSWLPQLSTLNYSEFLDDRYIGALDVDTGNSTEFAVAYMVRAVSPGTYTVPGVQIEDMYAPEVRGRGGRDVLNVAPY
ncbi:MG2 domain-containing protein [Dongia sp.]|uniref:alpha-2-macroglobulin family protein n=1 Tax=Dongia sp. TaxID=1977262 RepID=UPI0035B49E7F